MGSEVRKLCFQGQPLGKCYIGTDGNLPPGKLKVCCDISLMSLQHVTLSRQNSFDLSK